jgi:2-polyprenyl-3-methyl-5-hydroxy-6-metoxy-1,4-benzoquinol methylase
MRFDTEFTGRFVKESLPHRARRILEIGCGSAELAESLQAEGMTVVAIDQDPESVATARARSVDARIASWPDFEAGRFDPVLFYALASSH